jgi:hypothetical protein
MDRHSYDPVRSCCIFDADAEVHNTTFYPPERPLGNPPDRQRLPEVPEAEEIPPYDGEQCAVLAAALVKAGLDYSPTRLLHSSVYYNAMIDELRLRNTTPYFRVTRINADADGIFHNVREKLWQIRTPLAGVMR